MKKILILLLGLLLYNAAHAQTWNIGTPYAYSVTARLNGGKLTISGTGDMRNFDGPNPGPWGDNVIEAVIEPGVTSIGDYAFGYCDALTSVVIPEGVTSIGEFAFVYAEIKTIVIPGSVTNIGDNAFFDCDALTSVVISEGVTSTGESAFSSCSSLTSVVIPESVTNIDSRTFDRCTALTSVINRSPIPQNIATAFINVNLANLTLTVPCGSLSAYQNAPTWGNFGTIVEDGCPPKSSISNTRANFSCPGQVSVTYDLNTTQPVDATLYYSADKQNWLVAQTVSGDLSAQSSGSGKTILWDNAADNVSFGKFYFKVEVPFMEEPEPDCVMINGVCWATRNVDAPGTFAQNPEDAGMFYQWNRKVGWSSTDPIVSTDGSAWDATMPTGTEWEAENDPCPNGFRVPTTTELQSLADAGGIRTTQDGKNGLLFGSNDNVIFLPAAGGYNASGILNNVSISGYYWSSTNASEDNAYNLRFSNSSDISYSSVTGGYSIRCVKE